MRKIKIQCIFHRSSARSSARSCQWGHFIWRWRQIFDSRSNTKSDGSSISNLLVVACHRVQKLSSVDASDQEIWTDESETIHGEDPLANEYDGQKVDAEVVPKDIPLHERGVDAAFGEGDKNSNNPLESSSQSKSKKKKKKKKKKKEQNASEETGSQTIDQSVNKDEEEKAGIASNQIATSIPFFSLSA